MSEIEVIEFFYVKKILLPKGSPTLFTAGHVESYDWDSIDRLVDGGKEIRIRPATNDETVEVLETVAIQGIVRGG